MGEALRGNCPILANVTELRDARPRERLADLLTSVHFSGQRLPFRRLQALLALTTTGGLRCADVLSGPVADATAVEPLFRTSPQAIGTKGIATRRFFAFDAQIGADISSGVMTYSAKIAGDVRNVRLNGSVTDITRRFSARTLAAPSPSTRNCSRSYWLL
jgi:hypothetical protein